jgi:hypothetical protein
VTYDPRVDLLASERQRAPGSRSGAALTSACTADAPSSSRR